MSHLPDRTCLTRRRWLALLACPLAAQAQPLPSAAVSGRTLRAGPGERWKTFGDALRAAGDGDTIELQPGEYSADVGVAEQQRLTIRGLGGGAVLRADGRIAEGKAILVTRGSVAVENVEFRGARAGGNGAGIRFERGQLALSRCRFFDNENGLLSALGADMTLDIDGCEFGQAPRHEGLLHHLLYVGGIGRLTVLRSRFGGGYRGHLLKSRAQRSTVRGNLFDDGPAGEASYEIEFPNGGDVVLVGNVVVQSPKTQNPVLVSVGAEAGTGMTGRLLMAHNTLVNEVPAEVPFVRVWTDRLPADTPVQLVNNLFAGAAGWAVPPAWDGGGNQRIALAQLRDAAGRDFRLAAGSALRGRAVPVPPDWLPAAATAGGALSAGALQSPD